MVKNEMIQIMAILTAAYPRYYDKQTEADAKKTEADLDGSTSVSEGDSPSVASAKTIIPNPEKSSGRFFD